MKLRMVCYKCIKQDPAQADLLQVAIQDRGRYEIICPYGHEFVTLLQNQKFEILFDLGINAIMDGYYREAVSSFAASLERFYEFFIRALLISGKAEPEKFVKIEDAWKSVKKQSERQLGAFIFLYLKEFGVEPPILNPNLVSFRNNVVHEGKIPTSREAINFGQEVFNLIKPVLESLKKKHSESVKITATHYRNALRSANDSQLNIMSIGTQLSVDTPISDNFSLQALIESWKDANRYLKFGGRDVESKGSA